MPFLLKILLFFFILTFLFGYSSFTFAQGRIVCDEPIPIGVTLEELGDLMNELYIELRKITGFVDSAGEHMKGVITDLSQGGPRICDYSKCTPIVNLVSPDFGLSIRHFFGKEIKIPPAGKGLTWPFCMPQKCIGEPCPDLEREADTLKQLANGIESSFKKLKKIILEEKVIVTEDLNEIPEEVGDTITQAESVKRNLAISRLWLYPGERAIDIYSATHDKKEIIGRKSCTLGVWERQQIAAGEIVGERFPMQCLEALRQGLYWPRPWSELCHYPCEDGINSECIECLRNSKNNKETASILAKINYWIYKNCGNDCCKKEVGRWKKCEFTKECHSCLCGGTNLTQKREKECLDWVCGGSQANFVCCHEAPLEFYVGFDKVIDVAPIDDIADELPKGTISRTCAEAFLSPPPCTNWQNLANHYQVPFPRDNAPQLNTLIKCLQDKSKAVNKPLGSVFTFENKRPVCNYTRGQKICRSCTHSPCSCHYGGIKGKEGALAVDIGNEKLWDEKLIQGWLEECQSKNPDIVVCAIRETIKEKVHIHVSLPELGGCDLGLIERAKKGITHTSKGHPFKCWGDIK